MWWSKKGESSPTWKFHSGTFTEENSTEHEQVVVMINEEAEIAEDELDRVHAVLSRSSRKRFQKGLNQVIVSELYSSAEGGSEGRGDGTEGG